MYTSLLLFSAFSQFSKMLNVLLQVANSLLQNIDSGTPADVITHYVICESDLTNLAY